MKELICMILLFAGVAVDSSNKNNSMEIYNSSDYRIVLEDLKNPKSAKEKKLYWYSKILITRKIDGDLLSINSIGRCDRPKVYISKDGSFLSAESGNPGVLYIYNLKKNNWKNPINSICFEVANHMGDPWLFPPDTGKWLNDNTMLLVLSDVPEIGREFYIFNVVDGIIITKEIYEKIITMKPHVIKIDDKAFDFLKEITDFSNLKEEIRK